MDKSKNNILVYGIIGSLGAFLTIIADLVYNVWNGNQLGETLYITFLGLFSFPLWWGGIWVIYQGLKPAGKMWSLVPCLVFAFYTATVNVFYHSCYPFWAALRNGQATACGDLLDLINNMMIQIRQYTAILNNIDTILQFSICIWIGAAILFRKTYLPKWIVLIIPLCPTVAAFLINLICKGFWNIVEPYLACVPMLILFISATVIMSKSYHE